MGAQVGSSALTLGLPALGPQLRGEFGLSLAGLGAILAAPTVGYAFTMFLWGSLSDRVGERPVMALGLAGSGTALAVAATAGDALRLGLLLVLAGALGASAPAASGRAVVRWFPVGEQGLALGVRHTSPMVGGALSAALLPVAAAHGGTRTAMLLLTGFAVVGAVAALGVADAPGDTHGRQAGAGGRHPAGDRLVWMLAAGGALVVAAQTVLTRFLPAYLHDERGWSPSAAAALLSATLLGAAAARVVAGVVSDRRGRRIGVLAWQALGAGVLTAASATLLGVPSGPAAALMVGATILTMAGNGVAYAAVAQVAPHRTGAALGLYSSVLIVVVSLAPPAFGVVAGRLPWTAAFLLVAVFPLAGSGVLWATERARVRRAA